ncbi:unnamed protein product [Cuscuta campestris]|uniref:KHDC4/BBP-like KH-domain type I domain-containing protein n=1 Tax=Cuscuta campestris TaxID=132261 RepID=A0A484NQX6_9ASTE|nr:unnamed protein product [Cuscuta campestris]
MNINGDDAPHNIQSTKAPPSAAKVSILANKSGFVIPRNKLSGSLVPVFRGGKKEGTQSVNDDISKLVQRKTKWGPDLTQDTTVRKGRVLAYQTRIDQITQQLSSELMDWDKSQDTLSASTIEDYTIKVELQNIKVLELERREAIGELLILNPNYRPPAGYKPVQKEAKIPIPIKEHPGYNFLGMIFGPVSDTHKRLEKEIGAKVRVYGIKADTGQKVEITSSDENETCSIYKEMYIQVLADTYEKVDTAVSLMELLVTPVSVKTTSESMTISSNNGITATTDNPGVVQQPIMEGSGHDPSHSHFQQSPWFPGFPSQSSMPSTESSLSNACSTTPSLIDQRGMVARFGSVPQSHSLTFMRPNVTLVSQQPNLAPLGAPKNPLTAPLGPTAPHGIQVFRPAIHNQLPPFGTGWSAWNSSVVQGMTNAMLTNRPLAVPRGSSHPVVSMAPPSVAFPRGDLSGSAHNHHPPNSVLQQPQMQHVRSGNPNSAFPPQPIPPSNSVSGRALNIDAINSLSVGASMPHQQPGSRDFVFQPHQINPPAPSRAFARPANCNFDPPSNFVKNQPIHSVHAAPQSPSIVRPEIRNSSNSLNAIQGFPEMQANNRMIQWQPTPASFSGGLTGPPPQPIRPTVFPNSGGPSPASGVFRPAIHNFSPAVPPPMVNPGSPFPPRSGNMMFQHNNPAMVARPPNLQPPTSDFRPGNPPASGTFGKQQTYDYDPLSPTSLS